MFSGKTTKLLEFINKALLSDKPAHIYKPAWDSRYSEDSIVSHSGLSIKATPVSGSPIYSYEEGATVFFDEAQFFSPPRIEMAIPLHVMASIAKDRGMNVVCAGLYRGANGAVFEVTKRLMDIADEVIELRATCHVCGEVATETQRLGSSTPQLEIIDIGGKEKYQPVCLNHFSPVLIP
jgi:thymidine kinase